jgi:hypothetical protein
MRASSRAIGWAVAVGLAAVWGVRAEDAQSDPYVKVAVARAKVEVAIRDAGPVCDGPRSGWGATWSATDATWEKLARTLERAMEKEERRPEEVRDQPFIEDCRGKREAKEEDWRQFQSKRTDLNTRFEQSCRAFDNLSEMLGVTAEIDRRWKEAGIDLAPLESVYAAMEKRVFEVREQARKALDDETAALKDWEAALAAAEKAVARP